MNEQTLELQIKTTAEGAVSSVKLLNNNLTNTKQIVDKTSTSINKLGKAFSLGGLYVGVKRLTTQFLDWMNLAVDRTEQLNLFNVVFKNIEKNGKQTFSELGKSATKFQNKLNETFGTNFTDTTKYQGLFQSMGQNVGIADKYSAIMSETMTKLTYDLGSLYNKSEKDVAEALRAGVYAGQTKPLRAYGIDVTQTSLTPVAQSLGITDRTVKEMSQAEKEILRYIATLKQARIAMGDYANTIESPANQTKVFKNTLVEAKVALTSLFIGTFSKILPYANAILMVIKEVSKAIATMFGIKISDYNNGIATQAEAYEGLEESIDGATDSAKKLKREVLSFDQIHNINEDNGDIGSSGASGLTGGIDQRLLDAINGYDNGMDKVRMKATEIRDKIMEWLGFTKHINSETGETYFKLDNTNSTMYKVIEALKEIVKYGKEAISGVFNVLKKDFDNGAFGTVLVGVLNTIKNIFKYIAEHKNVQNIIAKIIEGLLLFKTVTSVLKPFVALWKSLIPKIQTGAKFVETLGKQFKGTNNYIVDANGNLKQYNKTVEGHSNVVLNADGSINKWRTNLNKAKTALEGIAMAVGGLYLVHDAMKSIVDEGPNVVNVLQGITGSLSTIGGFATIGSLFGPVGTAIGAVAGVVAVLIDATETAKTKLEELVAEGTASGMKNWAETVSNAKSHLSEFNDYLFASDDEIAELQANMENIQSKITEITKLASDERRNYTEEEIKKLNEYFDELEKLNDRQLQIQQAKTNAILQQAKTTAENNQLSLDEYKMCASEWIKTATEQKDNMISIINEQTTNELVLLNQRYGDEANLSNEAYKKEYDAIMKRKQEKIDQANNEIGEIYAIYTEGYLKRTGLDEKLNIYIKGNLAERQELEESHQKAIEEIMENENLTKEQKNAKANALNEEYNKKMKKIIGEINSGYENFVKGLSKEEQDQLGTLIAMATNTEVYGGKINEKTSSFITSIINTYGQMPEKTKNTMKNALEPMLDEMNKKEPILLSKAKSMADGILKTLRNAFDIHSPSKKTKSIFKNVMLGMLEGIDAEENPILNKVSLFSDKVTNALKTNLSDYRMDFSKDFSSSMYGSIKSTNTIDVSDSLASKISGQLAMAINGQVINVQLDAHTDEGVIIDRINQTTKQTGVCPINISY